YFESLSNSLWFQFTVQTFLGEDHAILFRTAVRPRRQFESAFGDRQQPGQPEYHWLQDAAPAVPGLVLSADRNQRRRQSPAGGCRRQNPGNRFGLYAGPDPGERRSN